MQRRQPAGHSEFLPALLEIQETPPPPLGRALAWLLMCLATLAVIWAVMGEVDIVAVARGRVVPSGHVKLIQPLESGVIRSINVTDGERVRTGDVLLELDPTETQADRQRTAFELASARLKQARLQAQLAVLGAKDNENEPHRTISSGEAAADYVRTALEALRRRVDALPVDPAIMDAANALHRRLLVEQLQEYAARAQGLASEVLRRQAEVDGTAAEVRKLEAVLPLMETRVQAVKVLNDRNLVASYTYLEIKQSWMEKREDLKVQRALLRERRAGVEEARQQLSALRAQFRGRTVSELAEVEQRIQQLEQEDAKAAHRAGRRQLRAPITGTVAKLAVHTIGGVVTSAQQLMTVVPLDVEVEVEAALPNREIGFVETGAAAEVKVDAFPFTRFGTLPATVVQVSRDTIADEKTGSVYPIRVRLKRDRSLPAGLLEHLTPGMAVTVEVKTGKRRIIEFLLSPVLQHASEAGRER